MIKRFLAMEKLKQRYKDSHHSVQRAVMSSMERRNSSTTTTTSDLFHGPSSAGGSSGGGTYMTMSTSISSAYFRPPSSSAYLRPSGVAADSTSMQCSTPRSARLQPPTSSSSSSSLVNKRSASNLGAYSESLPPAAGASSDGTMIPKSIDYHPQDRIKFVHSAPASGLRNRVNFINNFSNLSL